MEKLWKTKTFWVGLATLATGVGALLTSIDFGTVNWTIGGLWGFAQQIAGTEGWTTILLGVGMITARHALAKIAK